MKVISHKVYPERGVEEVILEDCHGRKKHILASILDGPPPAEFIAQETMQFEAQEAKISEHVGKFKPLSKP